MWVTRSQNPPLEVSDDSDAWPRFLPKKGMGRRSILSPRTERLAGRKVSVPASATSTTRMAPSPSDWKKENGTMRMPHSAITTVRPLNSTVRPAVAPARPMASSLSRPRAVSSR